LKPHAQKRGDTIKDDSSLRVSLRKLSEDGLASYHSKTLEPYTEDELEALREFRIALKGLIETGLVEAVGERDGRTVWGLTALGRALHPYIAANKQPIVQ
jgi:hypothetical protein